MAAAKAEAAYRRAGGERGRIGNGFLGGRWETSGKANRSIIVNYCEVGINRDRNKDGNGHDARRYLVPAPAPAN